MIAPYRGNSVIIADARYGLGPWIMTPYKNPAHDLPINYIRIHAQNRIIIESVFGQFKRRFPLLSSKVRLHLDIIPSVIVGCFVLHNIAKHLRDRSNNSKYLCYLVYTSSIYRRFSRFYHLVLVKDYAYGFQYLLLLILNTCKYLLIFMHTSRCHPWLPGYCCRQLRRSTAGASVLYSLAERVFVLEHSFASKPFAIVREGFSSAYLNGEVPNKTTLLVSRVSLNRLLC
jgi:hypothetical protein